MHRGEGATGRRQPSASQGERPGVDPFLMVLRRTTLLTPRFWTSSLHGCEIITVVLAPTPKPQCVILCYRRPTAFSTSCSQFCRIILLTCIKFNVQNYIYIYILELTNELLFITHQVKLTGT